MDINNYMSVSATCPSLFPAPSPVIAGRFRVKDGKPTPMKDLPLTLRNQYSSCRGKTPQNGFTTDQKARMFANAIQFRRGYEAGECSPDGKAAKQKRSSMQDLLDGKCPDYNQQASILLNKPHSLGMRLFPASRELWAALGGVWVAALLLR